MIRQDYKFCVFEMKRFFWDLKYFCGVVKTTLLNIGSIVLYGNKKVLRCVLDRFCFYEKKKLKHGSSIVIFTFALSGMAKNAFYSELKKLFPQKNLIVVVDNFLAHKLVENLELIDKVIYAPWDFKFLAKKMNKKFNIVLTIFSIRVLYPSLVMFMKEKNICVGLVAGEQYTDERIILNKTLDVLDFFSVRIERYKNFFKDNIQREKILVLGDVRDSSHALPSKNEKNEIYSLLKLNKKDKIIIAGATRVDEGIILDAYKLVLKQFSDVKLIIVPRQTSNYLEIEKMVKDRDLRHVRVSQIQKRTENIILYDTVVNLSKLYSIADIIIFARTFVPPSRGNGFILEAGIHGKPVIFGPKLDEQLPLVEKILEEHPRIQVKNSIELSDSILYFLKNKQVSSIVGQKYVIAAKKTQLNARKNAAFIKKVYSEFIG